MNTDILKGNWDEVKGEAKQRWSKLTDDDLASIKGDSEKLSGMLQKYYGYAKDEVKSMIDDFKNSLDDTTGDSNGSGSSGLSKAANKVSDITSDVVKKTKQIAEEVKNEAGEYGKAVVDFIEKKPYQSLAIAALAGLAIGLLFKKA
jgi:uncharacterized protein YjbJ (UPF0337 family)